MDDGRILTQRASHAIFKHREAKALAINGSVARGRPVY
jgi:hypothetical protein